MNEKSKDLLRRLKIAVTVDFLKDLGLTKEYPIYYIDNDSCLNLCLEVDLNFYENFIDGFEVENYMESKRKCSISCFVENDKILLNVGDLKTHNFTFGISDKYVIRQYLIKGKIVKVYFVLNHEDNLYYIEQHFKIKKKQKDLMKLFLNEDIDEINQEFDKSILNFVGDIVKTHKITNDTDLMIDCLYRDPPRKQSNDNYTGPEFPIF